MYICYVLLVIFLSFQKLDNSMYNKEYGSHFNILCTECHTTIQKHKKHKTNNLSAGQNDYAKCRE